MEKVYLILDTESREVLLDNLSYDEAQSWLLENGDPTKHVLIEK